MEQSWFAQHAGLSLRDMIDQLCTIARRTVDPDVIVARRNTLAAQRICDMRPITALHQLIHRYADRMPLGVVTGYPRAALAEPLRAYRLDTTLHHVITGDDVEHGKPDPEGYRLACNRFGVHPSTVQVFEDSPEGIGAAAAAGIGRVVDIRPLRALTRGDLTADATRMLVLATPWANYGGPPAEDILIAFGLTDAVFFRRLRDLASFLPTHRLGLTDRHALLACCADRLPEESDRPTLAQGRVLRRRCVIRHLHLSSVVAAVAGPRAPDHRYRWV